MRFLFTTMPGCGHLNLMLPYARALATRGHDIQFATAASFCSEVEQAGFPAAPCGMDWTGAGVARSFPAIKEQWLRGTDYEWYVRNVELGDPAVRMVDDLRSLVCKVRPDALVRDHSEHAAAIVAELADLPVAVVQWAVSPGHPAWGFDITDSWHALRARVALEPTDVEDLHGQLCLSQVPPSWERIDGAPPPATSHSFRPALHDSRPGDRLPDWIDDVDGPLVYATLGTVCNRLGHVRRRLLEVLREIPATVLLTTGRDCDPNALHRVPHNVRVERYVAHSLILERCDLMVAHGGLNTTLGALASGTPMVLLELGADHSVNGRMCEALGCGRLVPGRFVNPAELHDAILTLLADEQTRRRAACIREEIRAMPPEADAVPLFERLVRTRTPVLSPP